MLPTDATCRLDAARLPSVALLFMELRLRGKAEFIFLPPKQSSSSAQVDSDEEVLLALKEPTCI